MPKLFPPGTRERFLEAVCWGMPIARAAESHGVSAWSGSMWWKQAGVVGLQGQSGAKGGLPGSAPVECRAWARRGGR